MEHNLHNKRDGNAAVAVIFLLLIAGAAAWWFLFRTPSATVLPDEPKTEESQGGYAYRNGAETARGSVTEMGSASDSRSPASSISDLTANDQVNIDWEARHAELKQQYADEFVEPKTGMKAKLLLASGKVVEGTINDLTKDSITLRIVGTGKATYSRSQISDRSQLFIFKDVFAEYSAQKKLASEKAGLPAPPQ